MTTTPNQGPSLQGLSDQIEGLSGKLDKLTTDFDQRFDTISRDLERSNDKFDAYQKGTQWVVQLAFTLIASATLTIILSTVFK
ncbi:hypothetical protein C7293_22095 [filamentous cyanobacterium CCT1]|nr:hypothetical protein C7293_22095 [filamentous cyanobacterium CCT1]PSN78840.1 hypothetical protein C8B47_14785 [filamentous cyanobacterium CCP4]